MKQSEMVGTMINSFQPHELIFAGKLYREELAGKVSEAAYFKTLERMCKTGELEKAAKGTYYLPKISRFGAVPLSEKEIISAYTKEETGTVVGYSLYTQLGLTTQIAKVTEVVSSSLDSQTKTIRNVVVQYLPLKYTKAVKQMVQALDVLQNIGQMQDMNYHAFVSYCKSIAENFDQTIFEEVFAKHKYPKATIAFLQNILNYYGKENQLSKYLSSLSNYKYPRMEELHVAAQLPN